jgi:hypothetical protein
MINSDDFSNAVKEPFDVLRLPFGYLCRSDHSLPTKFSQPLPDCAAYSMLIQYPSRGDDPIPRPLFITFSGLQANEGTVANQRRNMLCSFFALLAPYRGAANRMLLIRLETSENHSTSMMCGSWSRSLSMERNWWVF